MTRGQKTLQGAKKSPLLSLTKTAGKGVLANMDMWTPTVRKTHTHPADICNVLYVCLCGLARP